MTNHEQHELFLICTTMTRTKRDKFLVECMLWLEGWTALVSDMSGVTSFCCCCLHDFVWQWSQDMSLTSRDPSCFITMTNFTNSCVAKKGSIHVHFANRANFTVNLFDRWYGKNFYVIVHFRIDGQQLTNPLFARNRFVMYIT